MKKRWIILIAVIVLIAAWYLLSPLFIDIEVNEPSPLEVKDALSIMSEQERQEFENQVEQMKDEVLETEEQMPSTAELIAEGFFEPSAHDVMGKALVIDTPEGKVLRFENFETVNGPDLFIYLSSDLSNDDIVDLGKIKATKGNVNYNLPENIDLEKYNKVLVWCRAFRVLFSYAQLNES